MKWLFETFKLWQIRLTSGVLLLVICYFLFFTDFQNFASGALTGILLVIFIVSLTYKETLE
jgi:hypothetical protein